MNNLCTVLARLNCSNPDNLPDSERRRRRRRRKWRWTLWFGKGQQIFPTNVQ
jgi:hypothetical protein